MSVSAPLAAIRAQHPLLHCISNIVSANDCANLALAIGASPIMAQAPQEMADIAALAGAVVLNTGTPDEAKFTAARTAGATANRRSIPVVLDPVGVGASPWRLANIQSLLQQVQPAIVRVNAGEAAALLGQGCVVPGEAKNTYGTGCFTLMNVGTEPVRSRAGLVSSVAWSVGGRTTYALEGSVFNGGSTIQWLRDELRLVDSAPECDRLAESVESSGGVVVVPAFTGLCAPYWDMYARGAILGITRGTGRAHIARAVLECIAYQVTDLMLAMRQDAGCDITALRADGGASVSDILMQMQADLLRIPVDRPTMVETTAFGAASLAGLACGLWRDTEELAALRRSQRVFLPQRPQADCDDEYRLWKKAVSRACHWAE